MATATDYRLDGMPRVRVLCALTGELIYEPTHPWLEQVRLHLLKKWTWINRGTHLPAALTLFYLHFEVEQQPMDDFQCLGDLMLGRPLDIQCFVKAPQRPDIRHRKCLEDAIGQLQGQRLWSLLTRYRLPSLLHDQRGNQVNPLMLALQSASARSDLVDEGPSSFAMLLDAKCDPNIIGLAQQSPLLYAVGLHNNEAVEDLLIARADVNYAPTGFEPPLCVAIRHRMGDVAKTLLSYMADVAVRGHPSFESQENGDVGPTATELVSEDRTLLQLVRAHTSWHTGLRDMEEAD